MKPDLTRVLRLPLAVAMFSIVGMGIVQAQSSSVLQEISVNETAVNNSLRADAKAWGLNEQELDRYEQLMDGARGIWSPNLDPVTALGIEAETEQERRRYAELLVEVEKARVERELAFQRAYDEAWARLYPNDMPINPFLANDDGSQGSVSFFPESRAFGVNQVSRLSVHVAAEGCVSCGETIGRLLDSGVPMDIFVIDTDGNDNLIRSWAREQSIPVSRVQSREITLNHGQVKPALGVTLDSVPQVFTQ